MIIMGQWTRVENSNEVFLRVTNHTGQAEKNLLGPAGIYLARFGSPGQVDFSLLVRYGSSLGETPHYYNPICDVHFAFSVLFLVPLTSWLVIWTNWKKKIMEMSSAG